jgi:hypothetical protein
LLATVFDEIDDVANVRWLNARHLPEQGIVVVHVPPACTVRLLAAEVLRALGRSVPAKTPGIRDHGHHWAQAWLSTARPRCDLVVYGAQRLTQPARAWLADVAAGPSTNVWLITLEEPAMADQGLVWRWETFQSHPWHERVRNDELAGFPLPAGWKREDLPPFPLSHVRAHILDPDAWQGIHRLGVTYTSVRRYEFNRLLSGDHPPAVRNVSAALARLTMISHDRPDLTVLSRYLEHDLFLHGAILTIDIDAVLSILGADHADHTAQRVHRDQGACNPAEAARDVVGTLHEFGRPTFAGYCDIAADGTHAVELDGDRREIPPWGRWPLRAACWLSDTTSSPPHQRRRHASSNRLYGHLPPIADNVANDLRTGLEPLTSALQDAFTYEPYVAGATPEETTRADGFTVQAAQAIWTLRQHRRTQDRKPRATDPGVRWLLDNDLAFKHDDDGRPALRGWLLDAIKNDAYSRGPKFNEDYRIRFSSGLAQPSSAGYARHFKEPQRYFRTLTR